MLKAWRQEGEWKVPENRTAPGALGERFRMARENRQSPSEGLPPAIPPSTPTSPGLKADPHCLLETSQRLDRLGATGALLKPPSHLVRASALQPCPVRRPGTRGRSWPGTERCPHPATFFKDPRTA